MSVPAKRLTEEELKQVAQDLEVYKLFVLISYGNYKAPRSA